MKNRYYILGCLATLMGVMTSLYSCTDELEGMRNTSTRPSDVVCFTASLSDSRGASVSRGASGQLEIEQEEWLVGMEKKQDGSRGAPVSLLSGSAGVLGYGDDNSVWSDNQEYVFDGDELTARTGEVRWNTIAGNSEVSCHVYAPYNSTISSSTISYQVASTIADQQDLIVASWTGTKGTDYGTYKDDKGETVTIQPRTIPLTFEHTLTAVKFKIGFACTVTKLEVKGIYNSGTYTFGEGWTVTTSGDNTTSDYTFTFGENGAGTSLAVNASLTDGKNTLMMIPQTLGENAKVILTYKEDSEEKTITATLTGKVWEAGKMITYTIHKDEAPTTIYFDLAAGDISIGSEYSGKVYVNGEPKDVTGNHVSTNRYYVYQSSTDERYNAQKTGYASEQDFTDKINCRIPDYAPVPHPTDANKLWRDYIVNNQDVDAIITSWYVNESSKTAGKVGRIGTKNRITAHAVANTSYDLVIDDIYSTYQEQSQSRTTGGISFSPETTQNCVLTITTKGDNRLGNIHYYNKPNNFVQSDKTAKNIEDLGIEEYIRIKNTSNGSQIRFEGTGSLTVADVDGSKKAIDDGLYSGTGYYSNHYCAAIGGNDDYTHEHCMGIVINSGVLFAGSTAAENCSAIGGGGNGFGEVTINGGTVTAVASTTGTAIGGGIGFSSYGGEGRVYINGGNVYAYNKDNHRGIPSSAIGGAGSNKSTGTLGVVEITGGYVYAYSALGTAIGGGSSRTKVGGDAKVTITGGQVIAKSGAGAGIGGGSAYTQGGTTGSKFNGGTAIIDISGNPIIRTGSIGGGSTGDTNGKIGSAQITIGEGDSDIQAQFVMAAGAKETPTFTMNGGTIRNSYVDDEEYIHIQKKGGAVYLEDGTFTMKGGTIKNCSAEQGGAVYIESKSGSSTFKMEGGEIHSCFATGKYNDGRTGLIEQGHGGAVCLMGGEVKMTGGMIWNNYSENGDGGAIYISNGNFSMKERSPTITGNAAHKGNGGGVFVSSEEGKSVQVNLLRGIITNNTANNYGGGVCVDMGDTQNEATVTVGAKGQGVTEQDANPKITSNMAMMAGGGLYVRGEKAGITIHSGMIDGNDVSAYVKNENVANHLGEVNLIDGLVTHVVVTFDGNGGTLDGAATDTQKIVKDTNSKLKANSFVLGGHNFNGWNTRKDGKGTSYSDRGFIVASEPVTLYAQWKSQTSN